jgi:ATP-dependent exoDNAse (exonuclease V) alpha subunit
MTVQTDDGRSVRFDLKNYNRIDHGYAATIHKAQGMTVDRAHVLATPGMDAHGSYVALSRHRDGVDLHYGRDDFAGQTLMIFSSVNARPFVRRPSACASPWLHRAYRSWRSCRLPP